MIEEYLFYADPGHAWLAVKKEELNRLGIADKISSYSYIKNNIVYLEEDCDYPIFREAKRLKGEEFRCKEIYAEVTPIRDYDSYREVL